jgi:hypothetical protein
MVKKKKVNAQEVGQNGALAACAIWNSCMRRIVTRERLHSGEKKRGRALEIMLVLMV